MGMPDALPLADDACAPGEWRERVFAALIWSAAALVLLVFGWLMLDLIRQGAAQLSWGFLVDAPEDAGRAGGIGSVLVATGWLLAVALVAAVPVGLAAAIWLAEFTRAGGRASQFVRLALDLLAGMPSIVFGLFGSAFFCVALGLGYSILAGGLTLAVMILPIFIRTVEAGLSAVDAGWRRGAAALGLSRATTLARIVLPAAMPAITAGLMLGIGRAAAETAALIFTSGYVDRMPESWLDSGRALAIHIYDLSMNVAGGDAAAAASALVLAAGVLAANLAAVIVSRRLGFSRSPA